MAKKETAEKKGMCSWCAGWSAKEWLWALVSEGALYLFLWYWATFLVVNTTVLPWSAALVSLVLLNVALLACPVVRKHYL